MDYVTIAGYVGLSITGAISCYFSIKYKAMKSVMNTNEILSKENDALRGLLNTRENIITDFEIKLNNLETQIKIDAKINDAKMEEFRKELDLVKKENQLLNTQQLINREIIRNYRDILIEVKDKCNDQDCELCEKINKLLLK